MESPEIHLLHKSDHYQISNYQCNCKECHTSAVEFTASFNFCFVRTGYFEYRIFRKELEMHTGRVLVSKPGFEHITRHIDNQPDTCTVFYFTDTFYHSIQEHYQREAGWFLQNKDQPSILLPCPPELEYLHRLIVAQTSKAPIDRLLLDEWVLRLVDKIMKLLGNEASPAPLSPGLIRHHLATIEKAKDYLIRHFSENISLEKVAQYCCVSIFHFARLFKSVIGVTPYQYLIEVRLQHACLLLENSSMPVHQIAFQCGFNSLEHFANAYRQRFATTPSHFRKGAPDL